MTNRVTSRRDEVLLAQSDLAKAAIRKTVANDSFVHSAVTRPCQGSANVANGRIDGLRSSTPDCG